MTIYLYIKQHAQTGLLYFGKTQQDPISYKGSGLYWKRHLKKYGNAVNTLKVWTFEDQDECTRFAEAFSIERDIVNNPAWANLIVENALGGVPKGTTYIRSEISNTRTAATNRAKAALLTFEERKRMAPDSQSLEARAKLSAAAKGRKHTTETKQKISTGLSKPKIKSPCSVCGVLASPNNLTRWHESKCKHFVDIKICHLV